MDGQDIAQFLLREGWAELPIDVTDQAYVEASELAYSRGLGIWGDGPPLAKPAPVRHSARWVAVPRQGLPCIKCVRGAGPPPMTQIKIEANELACRNKEWVGMTIPVSRSRAARSRRGTFRHRQIAHR
jgi:hypothetical protein